MALARYRVRAYSLSVPRRIYRLTVAAFNADDARRMAALVIGPDMGKTAESPRRLGLIEADDEPCLHAVVADQEQVDGIWFGTCSDCHQNVAAIGDEDDRGEPSWELTDREFVDFRGTNVEVA